MSDLTNIMKAATENMYNIVVDYKKDLNAFNNNMENMITETEKNLGEIRKNWNDSNFESFNKIVKEKISKLKSQITRSKNLEGIIADTEKEFKDALKELE